MRNIHPGRASRFSDKGLDTMNKLNIIAILSLTALGLSAPLASAGFLCRKGGSCACEYTVCCKQPNAFSPPCCTPCGKNWPCTMGPWTPAPCPAPCATCMTGMHAPIGTMPAPAQPMPPATAAPGYMPPAPAEVGEPQAMMPMMPGYGLPTQPVAFQPAYGGYYPPMMPGYGYGVPQPMMPGYGMPQGMMPGYGMPMMMPGMQ
jgi:hypothetical protein